MQCTCSAHACHAVHTQQRGHLSRERAVGRVPERLTQRHRHVAPACGDAAGRATQPDPHRLERRDGGAAPPAWCWTPRNRRPRPGLRVAPQAPVGLCPAQRLVTSAWRSQAPGESVPGGQGDELRALPRRRYPTCRHAARRAQCRCGKRWRKRSRRPRRTSCPPGGTQLPLHPCMRLRRAAGRRCVTVGRRCVMHAGASCPPSARLASAWARRANGRARAARASRGPSSRPHPRP